MQPHGGYAEAQYSAAFHRRRRHTEMQVRPNILLAVIVSWHFCGNLHPVPT